MEQVFYDDWQLVKSLNNEVNFHLEFILFCTICEIVVLQTLHKMLRTLPAVNLTIKITC